ncbi:type III effector 1 [Pseudomonas guariconensis]|nr:type III effector 1 [Pseudomonas guariconensis]MEB3880068.1 type III effector 1 [Pseudomonas guariconensis]MEB3896283.1 type III effector 1 [Pseudomonas guariconensis]
MSASVSPPVSTTSSPILERLIVWAEHFQRRLNDQSTFFEVAENNLLVELKTHYSDAIDPRLPHDLLDAALQHRIDQRPLVFDAQLHAPYRPDGRVVQEIPETRRDVMVQLVESASTRLLDNYQDYLTRYWQVAPQGLVQRQAYLVRVAERVEAHCQSIKATLESAALLDMSVERLRAQLGEHEHQWHEQLALSSLATEAEREAVDGVTKSHSPHWYKLLDESQRACLEKAWEDWQDAQDQAGRALGDVRSLQRHASRCAQDYLDEHFDAPLLADRITFKRRRRGASLQDGKSLSLTELVAEGALNIDQLYELSDITNTSLLCPPPSAAQIRELAASVDAKATYLPALTKRHEAAEVKQALFDAYDFGLKYSAQRAVYAGHLQDAHHARLSSLRQGNQAQWEVSAIELFDGMVCSDLLVFFRSQEGVLDSLFLYAPAKPDGQEWIELSSLRMLSAEIGGWMKEAAGQDYLLSQLPGEQRDRAVLEIKNIQSLPAAWDLTRDLRSASRGYQACIEEGVRARMTIREHEVQASESPRWYSVLGIEERRVINLLCNEARGAEQAFIEVLKDYESFQDFARRTVGEAIKPYLVKQGITDPVAPESIVFDLSTTLADGTTRSVNLLDVVCYGYDDNSGIDHPKRGVRSLVGQDLSALRSADLARYARGAYVGEKYIAHVRERFLLAGSVEYANYQQLFGNALLSGMDRDLRVAHGRAEIDLETYEALTRLVTELGRTLKKEKASGSSEQVADHDGIFRLTIEGYVILGCYVFRHIQEGKAQDWLYAPAEPNGRLFSRYSTLGHEMSGVANDYLLARAPLAGRRKVEQRLIALASGSASRDSLRGLQHVITIAAEYEAYIEHALADVDEVTSSHFEVIRTQVAKGLLYALVPLSLVSPPFAALLGAYFVAAPLRSAIIAHTRKDTAHALQQWLLASWGLLGLMIVLPGFSLRAVRSLLDETRHMLAIKQVSSASCRRAPSMRLDKRWAVKGEPANLQEVTEAGIWQGTYRSGASSEVPGVRHFVRHQGRYFQVERDVEHGTLRVIKANRPDSLHREAIVRSADGRWVANSTGLRGGNTVHDLGRITDVRQVAQGTSPDPLRGALQGEAVVGRLSASSADNYLFTLNVQSCVAVSLYNPATKWGAVIHFDHNIRGLIERAIRDVLSRVQSAGAGEVRAVMAGGDWLGGTSIGEPIRSVLRRQGISAQWDHWSYSSCFGKTYGMTLDLGTGVTQVYTTSGDLIAGLYDPILRGARAGAAGISGRAGRVLARVRAEPLYQLRSGQVSDGAGRVYRTSEYENNAIAIHLVS